MKLDNGKNNKNNIYKRSKTSFIKKAFTLIELVVVIAVIAILAGVGVATYFAVNNSANRSATEQNLKQIQDLYTIYNIENEDSSFSSNDDKAYDFISSYLPEQGINSFDTDFINYIVLHKKDNSDDTKIVYVTTKPSYGYFYEDGNSLSEIKVFDKEEELKNSIVNDAEFKEYDTSILEEMSVEQASTLYSSDLDNDGVIKGEEVARKAIRITLKGYDNGKDVQYYLKNGESLAECDTRYLNGQDTTKFVSTGALVGNSISPFVPYATDANTNEKFILTDNIYISVDDLANFVVSDDTFVETSEAIKIYPDLFGTIKQFDENLYIFKDIVLNDVKTSIASSEVNLFNFPAAVNLYGKSERKFGEFVDCINYVKQSGITNDFDIYIGKECVIDESIEIPENVRVKISYDVTKFPIHEGANRIKNEGIITKSSSTPGHLIIKNNATITPKFTGYLNNDNESDENTEFAYYNQAAITVFSNFYSQKAGSPIIYKSAGHLTIEEGSKIILQNNVWMRAFGLIDGDGLIYAENGSYIMQHISSYDWLADYYYDVGDGIFPTQKFTFDNIHCNVELKKNASFIAWLAMQTEYDIWNPENNNRTTDAYFTYIGNISKDADYSICGEGDGKEIPYRALFGIGSSNNEDSILISRDSNSLKTNLYDEYYDIHELNALRDDKLIINFNGDIGVGNLKISKAEIKDYWFPLYNTELHFNKSVNFKGTYKEGIIFTRRNDFDLKIKILPGSAIYLKDLCGAVGGDIVSYDTFDYFEDSNVNGVLSFRFISKHPYNYNLSKEQVSINKEVPAGYLYIESISDANNLSADKINTLACKIFVSENLKDTYKNELTSIIISKANNTSSETKELISVTKTSLDVGITVSITTAKLDESKKTSLIVSSLNIQ